MNLKAKRHDLIKFDIQKFRIESLFKIPISFIDDNKYYLFETNDNIYIVHRSGLIDMIKKSDRQCFVAENEQFRSLPNECFSKFHYMRDQKILIMYERNAETFNFVDFKNESKLEVKKGSKLQIGKIIKVKFIQTFLVVQTIKKIMIFGLPEMKILGDLAIKAKYFELAPKFFRLVSYDFETNSVSISQAGKLEMIKGPSLYHSNFKKIDGLFINSEPNYRFCYFSLTEKMTNKIYVLSFDDVNKLISYLYTFNLDYFNITRLIFKPRHNLAICFDKSNKELRIYRTLNIYENRNYMLVKTLSEMTVEQSFDIKPIVDSIQDKPTFKFEGSTKLICQKGIYNLNYSDLTVAPIFRFDPCGIRRFLSFDFGPKNGDQNFSCFLFTHEMEGLITTHIIVFINGKEKIFHDDEIIHSQLLTVDEKTQTIQIFGLLQNRKSFRLISLFYDATKKSFRKELMRFVIDENPHNSIHAFFVLQEFKKIYIINRKTDTFEILNVKYDYTSETFLKG